MNKIKLDRNIKTMKLSKINDQNLNDKDIATIVYSNIKDNGKASKYGLVFGNSMLIKERVAKAVELYNNKRIQKVIFMGGTNGVSNQNNSIISEADKMKELAIEAGIDKNDIILDNTSNNTFENIDNAMSLLKNEIDTIKNITVITSEFHLKRCYAILKKNYPNINITLVAAKDGFSDSDNWFLSDNNWNSGRSLATYEAHLLIKYAKQKRIEDLEIQIPNIEKER